MPLMDQAAMDVLCKLREEQRAQNAAERKARFAGAGKRPTGAPSDSAQATGARDEVDMGTVGRSGQGAAAGALTSEQLAVLDSLDDDALLQEMVRRRCGSRRSSRDGHAACERRGYLTDAGVPPSQAARSELGDQTRGRGRGARGPGAGSRQQRRGGGGQCARRCGFRGGAGATQRQLCRGCMQHSATSCLATRDICCNASSCTLPLNPAARAPPGSWRLQSPDARCLEGCVSSGHAVKQHTLSGKPSSWSDSLHQPSC